MFGPLTFTDLEEGLYGPDGTRVLRETAGRLISIRAGLNARIAEGLPPESAAPAALALSAVEAAERIITTLKPNGA